MIIRNDNNYLSQRELDMIVGRAVPSAVPTVNGPMATLLPGSLNFKGQEVDPNGLNANTPGAKLDAGKVRPALVLGGFARALLEISKVGTFGAVKYTENGWMQVPNGEARYDDAKLRHWLYEKCGIENDPDTELVHAAHEAWNAIARLDLILRRKEKVAT